MNSDEHSNFLKMWDIVTKEKSVWSYLTIEDFSLYFKKDDDKIKLTSFKTKDLPDRKSKLTLLGNIITSLSPLANIMSRAPGTEEVTFYSLLSIPQTFWGTNSLDLKMLTLVAPPISWRRVIVESSIRYILKKYMTPPNKEKFLFIDIGSGGGFDGLEINRIAYRLNSLCSNCNSPINHEIVNIDISENWLNNNEAISKLLFGRSDNCKRYNISIFDYLKNKFYLNDFHDNKVLIISCNGFAEFLSDEELRILYEGIYEMTKSFNGKVHIILPFSIKNESQEKTARLIGFPYRAKSEEFMKNLIKEIFIGYTATLEEKYSQMVMTLER